MLNVNEQKIDRITEAINHLLEGRAPDAITLESDAPEDEVAQLTRYVNRLISEYGAFSNFLFDISRGDLDSEAPKGRLHALHSLKNLQANLRHLTWKTNQIAHGDFTQRVDFMGEFSDSFNLMVGQLAAARAELLAKNEELDRISRTDLLTGLMNRRGALEALEKEVHRANRSKRPFVVIIADVDHFKRVNDTYGHDAGDAVLVELAGTFMECLRLEDLCARWGGEELVVLCPDSHLDQALILAERIRQAVRDHDFDTGRRQTVSIGVATLGPSDDIDQLLNRADQALYIGKSSGRDRVCSEADLTDT